MDNKTISIKNIIDKLSEYRPIDAVLEKIAARIDAYETFGGILGKPSLADSLLGDIYGFIDRFIPDKYYEEHA